MGGLGRKKSSWAQLSLQHAGMPVRRSAHTSCIETMDKGWQLALGIWLGLGSEINQCWAAPAEAGRCQGHRNFMPPARPWGFN